MAKLTAKQQQIYDYILAFTADLADGGGIAMISGKSQDIVVNLLLLCGQFGHGEAPFGADGRCWLG